LQLIPRFIWESKPEVYGFWLVMEEHLPGLYSGPTGMSASLSAPVDIFYGFGLVFGLPIIFLFGNYLNSINRLDVNKIYYPFLLCGVIGFTRSGLQIIPVIVLQITLITLVIYVLRRGKNA
jgi:Sec-independent protein secretion pathway component TatC